MKPFNEEIHQPLNRCLEKHRAQNFNADIISSLTGSGLRRYESIQGLGSNIESDSNRLNRCLSEVRVITGINVKEKVKAFENVTLKTQPNFTKPNQVISKTNTLDNNYFNKKPNYIYQEPDISHLNSYLSSYYNKKVNNSKNMNNEYSFLVSSESYNSISDSNLNLKSNQKLNDQNTSELSGKYTLTYQQSHNFKSNTIIGDVNNLSSVTAVNSETESDRKNAKPSLLNNQSSMRQIDSRTYKVKTNRSESNGDLNGNFNTNRKLRREKTVSNGTRNFLNLASSTSSSSSLENLSSGVSKANNFRSQDKSLNKISKYCFNKKNASELCLIETTKLQEDILVNASLDHEPKLNNLSKSFELNSIEKKKIIKNALKKAKTLKVPDTPPPRLYHRTSSSPSPTLPIKLSNFDLI